MAKSAAEARWEGSLKEGKGMMKLGSGSYEGPFTFDTRFGDKPGPTPEELLGAAHAGCFSMAFSAELGKAGYTPNLIHTTAQPVLQKVDGGFAIKRVQLKTEADIPGIKEDEFQQIAQGAKDGCPVSKALAGVEIELEASLSGK